MAYTNENQQLMQKLSGEISKVLKGKGEAVQLILTALLAQGHVLIEDVPGDGIVPIGCDGALIEYNLMRNCPGTLPHSEAAAGFWPWSCDNTVMQFNEVSDHKAPWDAQGFDSDYNCRNTTIQYY